VLQVLGPDAPEVAITSGHLGDVACSLGLYCAFLRPILDCLLCVEFEYDLTRELWQTHSEIADLLFDVPFCIILLSHRICRERRFTVTMHASNRRRPAETERTRPCPERIRPGAAEAYKAYKTVLRIREQSDPFALGLAKVTPSYRPDDRADKL
jgi:hypothetical protein